MTRHGLITPLSRVPSRWSAGAIGAVPTLDHLDARRAMRQDAGSQWAQWDRLVAIRILDRDPSGIHVRRRQGQLNALLRRRDRQLELAVLFRDVECRGGNVAPCLPQLKYLQQADPARRDWQLQAVRMNRFVLAAGAARRQRDGVSGPESFPHQFLLTAGEHHLATTGRRGASAAERPADRRLRGRQAEAIVQDIDVRL